MPEPSDLSDLLKDAVDEIPPFDPAAMLARGRHRRQLQLAGAASAAVVGLTFFVWNNASSNKVIVKTRSSTDETTTTVPDTTTSAGPTSTASSTTTGTPPPTVPGATTPTTVAASTDPTAADFDGGLGVAATTVHVGDTVGVDWSIVNTSDHLIEPFDLPEPWARPVPPPRPNAHLLAAICVKLSPDGRPEGRLGLGTERNLFYPPSITRLEPRDGFTWSSVYEPTVDDIGTVTCEVAILSPYRSYLDMDITARVTAIPAVTITVLPDDTTTTAAPTTTTTTTTAP